MKIENNVLTELIDDGKLVYILSIHFSACIILIIFAVVIISQLNINKKFIKPIQIALSILIIVICVVKYDKEMDNEFQDSYRIIQELKRNINSIYSSNDIRYIEVNNEIRDALEDDKISFKEWGEIKTEFITTIDRAQKQVPHNKEELLIDAQIKSKEELTKQYKGGEHE